MLIKYRIQLTPQEREQLLNLLRKKHCAAARQSHARILLKADEMVAHGGLLDVDIAAAVEVSVATVERVRRRFVEDGLAAALERKAPERTYVRRLDGGAEAKLIALTCGAAPPGCARWTLRLLADRLVELEVVPSVCHETVRQTLRANDLKPWLKRQWCIAPTGQCRFCLPHGGRTGSVSPSL